MATLYDTPPKDLHEAVHLAVGAASVCWEDMSGTGVFQDDHARVVAQALIQYVEANYWPIPEDQPAPTFEEDLRALLNKHGIDAKTHTADTDLAMLVGGFLDTYRRLMESRHGTDA